MLTMFTWGYRGWGNSTRQLLEAVDAREEALGFKPPFHPPASIVRRVCELLAAAK